MANYRFFCMQHAMLVGTEEAAAANDDAAVRLARGLAAKGHDVEIWRDHRRVSKVAAPHAS